MRSLSSTLLSAQKGAGVTGAAYDAIWKVVLSRSEQTTRGYDRSRVLQIRCTEEDDSQTAEVLLQNSDGALTAINFEYYQAILYRGYNTGVSRTAWAANTAYSVGDIRVPTTANGYQYRCTVAGTSHATTQPTWGTALGVTQTDGTVTWEMDGYAGEEYSPNAPMKVDGQEFISSETQMVCRLYLIGIPNQMAQDKAESEYAPDDSDTNTCKDLISAIAGKTLAPYTNYTDITETYDSEDAIIDSFMPKDYFSIGLNEDRLAKVVELLNYTRCKMRAEDDGELHIFVPRTAGSTWVANTAYVVNDYVQPTTPNNNFTYQCTTAGTSHAATEPTWPTTDGQTVSDGTVTWTARAFDYEYRLAVDTYHAFLNKSLRNRFVNPNKEVICSPASHSPIYSGSSTSATSYALAPKIHTTYRRLSSNAQGESIAKAFIEKYEMAAERGAALVPMNCGQEVYDWVKITDGRQSDYRIGNVQYIQWSCQSPSEYGEGAFNMTIRFGKVNVQTIGGLGTETMASNIPSWLIDYIYRMLNDIEFLAENQLEIIERIETRYLKLSGGIMTGHIHMGSSKVTDLAAPTSDNDAARKAYVDGLVASDIWKKWRTDAYHFHNGMSFVSNLALTNNVLAASPFYAAQNYTVTKMCVRVNVAVSGFMRVGIYQDNGACFPGALLTDAGTVSLSTTGTKEITGLSVSLSAGNLYWIAYVASATPFEVQGIYYTELLQLVGYATGDTAGEETGYSKSFTYAALPDPFPTDATVASVSAAVGLYLT